ncbi:hypothetical protein O181_102595 [Austropuccinia psidii MF-1]|uniref:Uncharacterized protein n=1 Tax=Austropuccinia psidii MF-1 TaxID=1389203 RepID=A0A9Q3PIW8_9BASI|nr:hypothetical protein [Austropuccinia psidii MF-1]
MLEKGWSQRLPYDTLKKDLVDINQTASSFKIILDKEIHHSNRCMKDSFKYAKEIWGKRHKPPDFKLGDLVLVSTPSFNKIKFTNKLNDSIAGTFMKRALHSLNAVQLEFTGELMNKHPSFPLILIKSYCSIYRLLLPLRNKPPLEVRPLEEGEDKKIVKVLKERKTRNMKKGNTL